MEPDYEIDSSFWLDYSKATNASIYDNRVVYYNKLPGLGRSINPSAQSIQSNSSIDVKERLAILEKKYNELVDKIEFLDSVIATVLLNKPE